MDPDERKMRMHELRVEILLQVRSSLAHTVRFSRHSTYPMLDNVVALRAVMERESLDVGRLLLDDSEETELERCNGSWRPAMSSLAGAVGHRPRVDEAAALFERHVLPMRLAAKTRGKYWSAWRAVCTWALSQGALAQILPMTTKAFHAFLWDALSFQCTLPVIKQLVHAIIDRHKHFKLGSPVGPDGDYSRYMHCFSRFQGRQRRPLYPIHRDIVVRLLQIQAPRHSGCNGARGGCSICVEFLHNWRDCLGTAVLTMGCCRVEDGADLDACDFWPDHDAQAGYAQFAGGCTLNIKRMKNDQHRRGCRKRFGRSRDPDLDVVDQLKAWVREVGLEPRAGCTKRQNPSEACRVCPPLLPRSLPGGAGFDLSRRPSSNYISAMVVRAVGLVGINTQFFSGICARKGGLSTAIENGVPEEIVWMQSGHANSPAARRYVELGSPALLYKTWEAFKL